MSDTETIETVLPTQETIAPAQETVITDQPAKQYIEVVHAATQKLPAFYTSDPETWFLQADAIFAADRITSQATRFNRTFGQLPQHVVAQVVDLAETPGNAPYDTLRSRLVSIYGASRSQKIQQTLDGVQLGDQRPSQLLRLIRNRMGPSTSEELLRVLWTRALPTRMRTVIAAWEDEELEKIAKIADRMIEVPNEQVISSVHEDLPKTIQNMQKQLQILTTKLDSLQQTGNAERRTPNRRPQVYYRDENNDICFYHRNYGRFARNCQQPCRWVSQPKSGIPKN